MKFVPKELKETADNSSGWESWVAKLKNFAIVVASLVGLYWSVALISEMAFSRISESVEQKIFMVAPFPASDISKDDSRMGDVRKIFGQLTTNSTLRPLNFKLRLLEMDAPNAFAAPGGWVLVTTGLLDIVTNETALGFVLAHELGHHQKRHTLKRVGRGAAVKLTFGLLFGGDGNAVVSRGVDLAELGNSRSAEREADEFGFRLAYETFGEADGYFEFFEWLSSQGELEDSAWMLFLNSHPASQKRIEHLRELEEQLRRSVRSREKQ